FNSLRVLLHLLDLECNFVTFNVELQGGDHLPRQVGGALITSVVSTYLAILCTGRGTGRPLGKMPEFPSPSSPAGGGRRRMLNNADNKPDLHGTMNDPYYYDCRILVDATPEKSSRKKSTFVRHFSCTSSHALVKIAAAIVDPRAVVLHGREPHGEQGGGGATGERGHSRSRAERTDPTTTAPFFSGSNRRQVADLFRRPPSRFSGEPL
ncbi:hypothetical protein EE612_029847, partial [Oryza sativa]